MIHPSSELNFLCTSSDQQLVGFCRVLTHSQFFDTNTQTHTHRSTEVCSSVLELILSLVCVYISLNSVCVCFL